MTARRRQNIVRPFDAREYLRDKVWKEVEDGKKALILSETPEGEKEYFINATKVFVKCNHCHNITNKQRRQLNGQRKTTNPRR